MDDFECGGLIFNSHFDSGNLGRVELVQRNEEVNKAGGFSGLEYKLYTKPDCGGTIYENGNRTWFYFSVRGGEPHTIAKFTVMNLNRQAKLYSQGMHPVVRAGARGKWERIKDKPSYYVDNENFVICFIHRIPEYPIIQTYYAFTYPFTYGDLSDYLHKLDNKYAKSEIEMEYLCNMFSPQDEDNQMSSKNSNTIVDKISVIQKQTEVTVQNSEENRCNDSNNSDKLIDIKESTDFLKDESIKEKSETLNETASSSNLCNNIDGNKPLEQQKNNSDLSNEIYYYRELLIYSLQGRAVDLLTITSFHNISIDREPIIENLFPAPSKPRAHAFKNKKIIFLSSRVHPGETPASFVLNGFINFILEKRNGLASTLRQMYVFKIVPFLNPDGVYNGMYRSDTMGQNLNRVYLAPKLEIHPTIYAAKKLIRFYHYGFDKKDKGELEAENRLKSILSIKENLINNQLNANSGISNEKQIPSQSDSTIPSDFSTSSSCDERKDSEELSNNSDLPKTEQKDCSIINVIPLEVSKTLLNVDMKKRNNLKPKENKQMSNRIKASNAALNPTKLNTNNNFNKEVRGRSKSETDTKTKCISSAKACSSTITKVPKKEMKSATERRCRSPMQPVILGHHQPAHLGNSARGTRLMPPNNKNISADYCIKCAEEDHFIFNDDKSNMFLYIDLHGHASKKGVFMYGNHLPNVSEAVECMLLPRLMSMNCHHFHFDSCNFSERNMYLKGKRDGLSKEGSGRVAIYKTIGLIKSYTLESNYNTGKLVNILPPKCKENSIKTVNLVPPKYCPIIFEEVGRALGPSILDLTNSNPSSRIGNSEFRTLQGMRSALKIDIDRSFSRNMISQSAKATKTKSRRTKTNSRKNSAQIADPLKENKALYEIPLWDVNSSNNENSSISILSPQTNSTQTTSQIQISLSQTAYSPSTLSKSISTSAIPIRPLSTSSLSISQHDETKQLDKTINKLSSNTINKHQKIRSIKSQTIFGKKENSNNLKKIKVFCDGPIIPNHVIGMPIVTEQQIQVPRKRIKVSQNQTHQTGTLVRSGNAFSGLKQNYPKIDLDDSSSSFNISPMIPIDEGPCCSLSILKRSHTNFIKNQQPTTPTISINSETSNVLSPQVKKPSSTSLIKSFNSYRKISSNSLRKCNSLPNLSKKHTGEGNDTTMVSSKKIKKKRVIKSDTTISGLKRKKSRVKNFLKN